jgi:xylulokinase
VGRTEDLILAIDQGTSAAKVVVFDLDGRIVAAEERDTALGHPQPTWIESDAESWWQTAVAGIRNVLARPGLRAEQIRAIGVCGFMHTLIPVDDAGRALCPPLLWPDQRCARETEELARHADVFVRLVGQPATTMSSVPRLRWLRHHHPDVVERARAFLLPKDFLRLRLTGEIATDQRDASGTGLTDRARGDWSDELLDLAGVSRACLPPIRRCDDVAGTVTAEAAAETGLGRGTPVVVGSGDWFATEVGSGCYLPERACLYLGTAGIIGTFASAQELDRLGRAIHLGSVTSTGSALRWTRELFDGAAPSDEDSGISLTYAAISAEAERREPGARGVRFLPHLMGERGGGMRPRARGTLHGLTLAHRRADVFRAVLEGCALWLRATTEPYLANYSFRDFLVMGGGARSPLWRRIFAAVYRRRLLLPEVVEGGAIGTAMLAAVGTGLRRSYRELGAEWTRIVEVEEPDPDLVEQYEVIYRDFRQVEAVASQLER